MDEIIIVDDDPGVRSALSLVFGEAGYQVSSFEDGQSFVAVARERSPACVILDMYMPGESGIDVLKAIDAGNYSAPVLVASARGDIPTAVEAIRNGATDFIEKRASGNVVERVRAAIEARRNGRGSGNFSDLASRSFPGRESLTRREHQVLVRIAGGSSNQEVADELGISRRTVEVHRAHILAKLRARNAADLVRIVLS